MYIYFKYHSNKNFSLAQSKAVLLRRNVININSRPARGSCFETNMISLNISNKCTICD